PGRHRVDVFSETLDMMRFPAAQIEGELTALFAKKYAAMHVDTVVAIGAASLDFSEKYRSRLWPDARIVFTGVPAELLRGREFAPTTTGIPLQHDLAGTVDLALSMRPATRRLIVISGSGDYDRRMARVARTALDAYSSRLTIEYWQEVPIDEFLRRLARLDS